VTFSPFDSPTYGTLYGDYDVRALFTDSAEVRAILLIEGTLAKVQGELGVIPLESALYIHRASMEVQVDPAGLAAGMAETGSPISALVAAFAKAMEAPEHSKYIHWGASSQDILDTALVLRLRQYLRLLCTRMEALKTSVRDTVLIEALKMHLVQLGELQSRLLAVRFSEGSNTAGSGDKMPEVEAALAEALKLSSSPSTSVRNNVVDLVSIISCITKSLDGMGQAASKTVQSVTLSTMAQFTANQSELIRQSLNDQLNVNLAIEKMVLGQVCIAGGVALKHAQILADRSNDA
jgi:3-carboxy-cis,cis-muconate cycloisomerase